MAIDDRYRIAASQLNYLRVLYTQNLLAGLDACIENSPTRKYKDFDYMSEEDYTELEKLLDEDKNGQ